MQRRLCLFTASPDPSGVGEHMLAIAAGLASDYDISFVCPLSNASQPLLAQAQAFASETFALDFDNASSAESPLVEWLRERHIDLFHCHAGIVWEGHRGIRDARSARVPVVLRTEHLPYFLLPDPRDGVSYTCLIEETDAIVCVSHAVGESFLVGGVPADKLHIIRNGITFGRPRVIPPNAHANLGVPDTARLVMTVARLTEQKGHADLLEAVPAILAREPETHFLWVGTGPLEETLRARAREMDVATHIHFLGKRRDVPDLLAAADLFVLPSRFEGLPLALLEAMAAGLPVVGTNVCGIAEVVVDRVTGRLVETEDVTGLAAAVLGVLEKPDVATRWGAAGRTRGEQEFNVARMVRETAALYEAMYTSRCPGQTRPIVPSLSASPPWNPNT